MENLIHESWLSHDNFLEEKMKRVAIIFVMFLSAGAVQAQWVQTNGPVGGNIITFVSRDSVMYAATKWGGVFVTTDYGETWTKRNAGLDKMWSYVLFDMAANEHTVWIGTAGANPWYTTNGGALWLSPKTWFFNEPVYAIRTRDDTVFAATTRYGIVRTTNNGDTWKQGSTDSLVGDIEALCVNKTHIYVGSGASGRISVSGDNGKTWTTKSVADEMDGIEAIVDCGKHVWAMFNSSRVFRTSDAGRNWTELHPSILLDTPAAVCRFGDTLLLGTASGIFLSTDEGVTWSDCAYKQVGDVKSLFHSGDKWFAGTRSKGVYVTSDHGNSWTPKNNGLYGHIVESIALLQDRFIVGTKTDGLYSTADNGGSWKKEKALNAVDVSALGVYDSIIYAGTENGLFRSTNNGKTWTALHGNVDFYGQVSCIFKDSTGIYFGSDWGLFRSSDEGLNWTEIANDKMLGLGSILRLDGMLFRASNGGHASSSSDNGKTWNTLVIDTLATQMKYIQCFHARKGRLFAGTGGGIYCSNDHGKSWVNKNNGIPDVGILCIQSDARIMYASSTTPKVFYSSDEGESWHEMGVDPDVFEVWMIFPGPTDLYAGTLGGSVWRYPLSSLLSAQKPNDVPAKNVLTQNFPNPFSDHTSISYTISSKQNVTLKIFDILGRPVASLVDEMKLPRNYTATFNAAKLPNGLYTCVFQCDGKSYTRIMTLAR